MQKIAFKIGMGVASALLAASALVPVAFADSVGITDNGADSTNKVKIVNNCTISVTQKNKTDVKTKIGISQNTGGNTANENTGGDVSITTGEATASATVTVGGSTNEATLPSCCECQETTLDVTIDGNGAGSVNKVKETNTESITVKQKNKSKVKTKIKIKQKTGKNDASNNTNGTTDITTGNTGAAVDVTVNAPSNTL